MTDADRPRRLGAEAALVGIAAVWGLTFVMVQDAIELLPTMAFLGYRFVPAALIVALVFRRRLRTLSARGYRRAAAAAYNALVKRFNSGDPAAWREPRLMYEPEAQGAGSFDPFPFYDRGTWQQIVELGPGT